MEDDAAANAADSPSVSRVSSDASAPFLSPLHQPTPAPVIVEKSSHRHTYQSPVLGARAMARMIQPEAETEDDDLSTSVLPESESGEMNDSDPDEYEDDDNNRKVRHAASLSSTSYGASAGLMSPIKKPELPAQRKTKSRHGYQSPIVMSRPPRAMLSPLQQGQQGNFAASSPSEGSEGLLSPLKGPVAAPAARKSRHCYQSPVMKPSSETFVSPYHKGNPGPSSRSSSGNKWESDELKPAGSMPEYMPGLSLGRGEGDRDRRIRSMSEHLGQAPGAVG